MKKIILFIALILLANSFNSCKKDSDEETSNRAYRLKERKFDGILEGQSLGDGKIVFSYKNEKISQLDFYHKYDNQEWEYFKKAEITYNGNVVTVIYLTHSDVDDTFKPFNKHVFTFDNENMIARDIYDYENGQWLCSYKIVYQYNNNNLISSNSYHDFDGDLIPSEKTTYTYNDNKVSNSITQLYNYDLGHWYERSKDEYSYDGNRLSSYQNYVKPIEDESWSPRENTVHTYTSGRIIETSFHHYNQSIEDWNIEPYSVFSFSYDSNNNIDNYSYNESGLELNYYLEYEEKEGNLNVFKNPRLKTLYYPDAFYQLTDDLE